MNHNKPFLHAARLISLIILASRILGLIRDAVLAACFGASRISDVFWFAFELPNLLRRVLGEGSLSAFIVPIFTKVRSEQGDAAAWRLASNAFTVLALITLCLTALGVIFARPLFLIYGYGYFHRGDTDAILIGARLTRIMFPFLMLLTLSAILMGLCHSLRHFSTPALGSIMLNLTMIVTGAIFIHRPEKQIAQILALSVLVGGLLRLLIMIPPLIKAGFRFRPVFDPASPQIRKLFLMLLPATFGLAIAQVNISISRIFAGLLGEGYNTALIYSNRLVQLPLAIIASALATAILPQLSQLWIDRQLEQLQNLVRFAFRLIFIIFVPATVGLMVLGLPIINILFQRNQWDQNASLWTYHALLCYAPGLTLWGLLRILTPIYYAQQNVRTPVLIAALAMIANVAMNVALVTIPYLRTNLSYAGLALANTISVFIEASLQLLILRKKGLKLWNQDLTFTALRTLGAAAVMGAVAWTLWNLLTPAAVQKSQLLDLAWLLAAIALAAAAYFLTLGALGVPDLKSTLKIILKKSNPIP